MNAIISRRQIGAWSLAIGMVVLLGQAKAALGQDYRGEFRVGSGLVQLRPLVRDSVRESEVPGEGPRRRLPDGTVATCIPNAFCYWYEAGDVELAQVVNQDLLLTGWANVQGLSAHAHLRGRYGSNDVWPLSSQRFEAVSAYLNFDRAGYRVRAGRLFRTDGLGYYNFDGASVLWKSLGFVWVEAYGGWSLARAINAPRSGSLMHEADVFAPDDRGLLFGLEVGGSLGRKLSGSLMYQRDIRTDRLAIYSERVALDGRALLGPAVVDLSVEYDLAYENFNEARIRFSAGLPAGFGLLTELRHYTPFFELWTIWGAFSPIGYNEAKASLAWAEPKIGLRLEGGGAYRLYEETGADAGSGTIRDNGYRWFGTAGWNSNRWFASGTYRAEGGFGAARFGGDAAVGYTFGPDTYLAARTSVTQTLGEFRLNEQLISGIGVDGSLRVGLISVTAGGSLYGIRDEERPRDGDWTQLRFHAGFAYRFGGEPRRRAARSPENAATNPSAGRDR